MDQQLKETNGWLLVGGILLTGGILYLLGGEPERKPRSTRSRSRTNRTTPALTLAREESKATASKSVTRLETKLQSEPKIDNMAFSTDSRSEKYSASVIPLTSNKTDNSSNPVSLSSSSGIRKYPDYYYTLSSKQQWKLRKKIQNGTIFN